MKINFRILRLVSLLSTFWLFYACGFDDRTPEQRLETSQNYMAQNKFAEAVIELKGALQQDPRSVDARQLLAEVYIKQGLGEDAEKEIRRAVTLGMAPSSAAGTLGKSLLLQSKYDAVLSEITASATLSDHYRAELLATQGNAHFGLGALDKAEQTYQSSLQLAPELPEALVGQARVMASRGDLNVAWSMVDDLTRANPEFSPGWQLAGDIAYAERRLDEAEDLYTKAIATQSYRGQSSEKRADVRLQKNNYKGALEDVNAARSDGYASPALYYVEGRAFFGLNDLPAAQQALSLSIQLNEQAWPAKIYLAVVLLADGRTQQAMDVLYQLHNEIPHHGYLRGLLGQAYTQLGEFGRAEEILREAHANNPDEAHLASVLGDILLQRGQGDEAIVFLERALAKDPGIPGLNDKLRIAKIMVGDTVSFDSSKGYEEAFMEGLAHFNKGNHAEALKIAQTLHDKNPREIDPLNLAAAAFIALGQANEAEPLFARVLEIDAYNPTASRNLATIYWKAGKLDSAEALLTDFIGQNPDDEAAVLKQSAVKIDLGKLDEAIKLLEQSLERNPNRRELRLNLAELYLETSRYDALLSVTSGLESSIVSSTPLLYELRARALLAVGQIESALAELERFLEQRPGLPRVEFLYADALARSGDKKRGKEVLRDIVSNSPQYLPARIGAVKMLVDDGDVAAAGEALSTIEKEFGTSPEVLGIRGWYELGTNQFVRAEATLAQAIEEKPSSELTLLLFRALWAQKKFDQAFEAIHTRLKQVPAEVGLIDEMAAAHMSLGQDKDAVKAYEAILDINPDHVLALNNVAWLGRKANLDISLSYAEKALDLAPNAPGVADTLAQLLILKDPNSVRAIRLSEKAANAAPDNQEIQFNYARLLASNKDTKKALRVLEKLIAKNPESDIAEEAVNLMDSLL